MNESSFARLMGPDLYRAAQTHTSVVYGVWADGSLAYFNPAWVRMALDNDGASLLREYPIGRNVWDAVPDILRPVYETMWANALTRSRTQEHGYDCSSPSERRWFRMRVDSLRGEGLLIRNDRQAHVPLCAAGATVDLSPYEARHGFITVCANCRRVRRVRQPDVWDWLPALQEFPVGRTSHGLCLLCLELHYPAA